MYEVIIEDDAMDFLGTLPKSIYERIINKLESSSIDPFHYFIRLVERDDYKLRVGDYRVIADIDEFSRIIKVTKIGHRRNIYK